MQESQRYNENIPFTVLKDKLSSLNIPKTPIATKTGEVISNPPVFLCTHIKIVENYSGKRIGIPYYKRLLELYYFLIEKNQ